MRISHKETFFLREHISFIIANRRIKMIERNRITIRGNFATIDQTDKHNLKLFCPSE